MQIARRPRLELAVDPQHLLLEHDPAVFEVEAQLLPPFRQFDLDLGLEPDRSFSISSSSCVAMIRSFGSTSAHRDMEQRPMQLIPGMAGRTKIRGTTARRRLSIRAKIPKFRPCRKQPPKAAAKPVAVKAPAQGRPCLSGRRFLLYFPRLSRAAAAEPQIRRAAGQCRARLLQHAVEAAARHAAGQPADASGHHLRQVRNHLPQQALSRLQGAPAAGAGRSDPAISR